MISHWVCLPLIRILKFEWWPLDLHHVNFLYTCHTQIQCIFNTKKSTETCSLLGRIVHTWYVPSYASKQFTNWTRWRLGPGIIGWIRTRANPSCAVTDRPTHGFSPLARSPKGLMSSCSRIGSSALKNSMQRFIVYRYQKRSLSFIKKSKVEINSYNFFFISVFLL